MREGEPGGRAESPLRIPWARLALVFGLLCCALGAWLFLDAWADPKWWGEGYLINRNWSRAVAGLGKPMATLWLLGLWAWVARRNHAALTAILAMLFSGLAVTPPKEIFRRVRPSSVHMSPEQLAQPAHFHRTRSFPSGDTAQAFAVATALAPTLPAPWRPGLFALAGIVGFKRFLGHAHYLSDVFAGAALGLLAGWAALALGRSLLKRAPPRRWRRRPSHFWLLVGMAVGEPLIDPYLLTHALKAWAPFLVVWMLLARGRKWLRWASQPKRYRPVLLGLLSLAALTLLPGLGWADATLFEQGSYLEAVGTLAGAPHSLDALESWSGVPLAPWLAGLLGACTGDPLAGARLLACLATLAALGCLCTLGWRLAGPRTGILAGALFAFSPAGTVLGRLAWPTTVLALGPILAALGFQRALDRPGRGGLGLLAAATALAGLTWGLPGLALVLLGLLATVLLARQRVLAWPALLGWILPAALAPLAWSALAGLGGAPGPLASWLEPPHPGGPAGSPWLGPLLVLAGLLPWLGALLLFKRRCPAGVRPSPAGPLVLGQLLVLTGLLAFPSASLAWQACLWLGPLALAAALHLEPGPVDPFIRKREQRLALLAAVNLLAGLLVWRFWSVL